MTTFRPAGFHLGPALPRSTEATGPRVWDVRQLCSGFFLLSLITQHVVETHRAASNSLKLSSWNGAQDTRGVVPSRCANHIKRRAGNKRAAVQVTQRLIFLSAHQFIGTRPHLKKRERGGRRRARRPFSCI